MSLKNFAIILGARPNFVKVAPFLHEAKKHPQYSFTIIHTGQHFDKNMSEIFFEEMSIPKPDIFLDIKVEKYSEKIGKMFSEIIKLFSQKKYDGVIVFGDVTSTLAGALGAVANQVPVFHIEAGLRSHDKRMPEEMNRVIVDHISSKLFITESSARINLLAEGIDEEKIFSVGNVMIECMELFWDKIEKSPILQKLHLQPKQYILCTIHRIENTTDKNNLKRILEIVQNLNKKIPVVLPMHPGTKKIIHAFEFDYLLEGIQTVEPLGYFDFIFLTKNAKGVITDSGGIQEETSHLGIPCITLRENTERPITIEKGSNKLFHIFFSDNADIVKHLERDDFTSKSIPLWDTGVSKRIFEFL